MSWGARAVVGAVALAGLAACQPTHNWRLVRHEGAPVEALLPCKPERAQREVPLLGPDQGPQTLHMMGCDVAGRTFALAALQVGPASEPQALEQRWVQATWATLRQPVPPGAQVPLGWTVQAVPHAGSLAHRWRGPALDHRGQPLQAELQWWAGAGWLVQAAVYAPQTDPELAQTLFESVRVSP